ncbi:DUF2391 family protein [Candidatus Woesearchaeota archaeon]|nr:DUF2391 family protein [Candidatus Woesearchaeota archaeon]
MAKKRGVHELLHSPVFHPKDFVQVMIGAAILAIPVGFTEETWHLGDNLPFLNILGFFLVSLIFISIFVYYTYYRNQMKNHLGEFFKRVFFTYVTSFFVVTMLLVLIQRAPWSTNWVLAFKRTVIVTFPSCMSAAIADVLR